MKQDMKKIYTQPRMTRIGIKAADQIMVDSTHYYPDQNDGAAPSPYRYGGWDEEDE